MIGSGLLRRRITVEQPVETQNAFGEMAKTWTSFLQAWASVLPLTGRELVVARQVNAENSWRVKMRYQPGITTKMRIQDQTDRTLYITSVTDPENRKFELVIDCKEQG